MRKDKVISFVFAGVLAAGFLWNVLTPSRSYSERENRYLQEFPSISADRLFSGQFGKDFETYTTDQFPMRDSWVALKTLAGLAMLRPDNGRVYFGENQRLFEIPEAADAGLQQPNCRAVAAFLEKVTQMDPTIRTAVMLAPTATTILKEELPAFAPVADEEALIHCMELALGESVVFCDPTSVLMDQTDRDSLYYRTDHHWTTKGAFLAYQALAEAQGLEPLQESDFRIETVADDFYGTLYSKANLPLIPADTIERYMPNRENPCTLTNDGGKTVRDSLYDVSYLEGRDKYAYFLGGNYPLTEIRTSVTNGRHLLVIKDSYAHALVPFLTAHYETISMVDLRYFKEDLADWMTDKEITDVLVLYNASTFAADRQLAAALS